MLLMFNNLIRFRTNITALSTPTSIHQTLEKKRKKL